MLELRRATVLEVLDPGGGEQRLLCEVEGERVEAIADPSLVGRCEPGDQVVVNVQARRLGLGSGGFDVVHVNLTRGLGATAAGDQHVMKLNYTSIQHAVRPVEDGGELELPLRKPVGILALHGQLAPVAWRFARERSGARLGFVQTGGGALPGGHSRTVAQLKERGLLADHITAAPAYGGDTEAISTIGAIHAGLTTMGWDAAVCGPGPGIVGSGSALGHGGMQALDSAHAALALGCETVLVARVSEADPRPRHREISHHTETVLELLLAPVTVALPTGAVTLAHDGRHRWRGADPDVAGYRASGLPARTMGRGIDEDELFFAAALAAGAVLASYLPA